MSLHELTPTDRPSTARGQPCVVAVVPGPDGPACLAALLAHTAAEVAIVMLGSAVTELAPLAGDERAVWTGGPGHATGDVERTVAGLAPADVALLAEPCLVGADWLGRLGAAARADSSTATASALTDRGGPLGLGAGDDPPAPVEELSRRVAAQSLRLRPRLARTVGPCVYLRRDALELVGALDAGLGLADAVEIDLAQRCVLAGLGHVAADDVVVGRLGRTGADRALVGALGARYPYLEDPPEVAASGVLPRALEAARRPRDRLAVTVDGRALGLAMTGTQVHVWQLIRALVATGALRLRVLVGPDTPPGTIGELEDVGGVEVLRYAEIDGATRVDAVFHRPQQVFDPLDLELAFRLGRRLVVNHLDLIAYRNPGYFPSRTAWLAHRRVTRQALAAADRVIVFSEHTRADICTDELAGPDRVRVVPPGLDHDDPQAAPRRPAGVGAAEAGMLLCLGTDFRHKNRIFALRLLRALSDRHGWAGHLVFAGAAIPDGSSRPAEGAYLREHPELARRVVDLGPVSEAEKAWLFAHASAVVYPSVYEGFGLVPFECARAGVPCLFAAQTSLAEVLPAAAATLAPWDEERSAANAHRLLAAGEERERHVATVRAAGEHLTWAAAAEQTLAAYGEAAVAPIREAAALGRDELAREVERRELIDAHDALVRRLVAELGHAQAEFARAEAAYVALGPSRGLIGPAGAVPEDGQRALLALTARPRLSRPVFAAVARGFRVGRALRRRRHGA